MNSRMVGGHFHGYLYYLNLEFADDDGKRGLLTAGLPVGRGLSDKAAEDLGLLEGTPVGSGVIDA
jgi:ribulose kinase